MTIIRIPHNHDLCHCSHSERFRRSLVVRMVCGAPKVLLVAFGLYIIGHVLVWIVTGFPGLLRIGGM